MAPSEPLSYDEIHSIQKRERSTRALTKVPQDFYERLASYVADAREGLGEESLKGPSPRLVLLQGQFRNLEEMAREIMLLRLRKVTELAFAAVEGGPLNEKGLTGEELAFARNVQGLAEATREGTRYAIVHGAQSSDPSGPGSAYYTAPDTDTKVTDAVEQFAGGLNPSQLNVKAEWLDGSNETGNRMKVTSSYDIQPLFGFVGGFSFTMTSSSTMKITY